jgi:predicted dehydrogenase
LNLLGFTVLINCILIVGIGGIGKRHFRLARELVSNADMRVLRHQVTNEAPEFSNGCFYSIEESIAFAPQIAVITSPSPFHIPTAQALAEVGGKPSCREALISLDEWRYAIA